MANLHIYFALSPKYTSKPLHSHIYARIDFHSNFVQYIHKYIYIAIKFPCNKLPFYIYTKRVFVFYYLLYKFHCSEQCSLSCVDDISLLLCMRLNKKIIFFHSNNIPNHFSVTAFVGLTSQWHSQWILAKWVHKCISETNFER